MKKKRVYIAAALAVGILGSVVVFSGDSDAASDGLNVAVERVSRSTIESTVTAQGEVFLLDNDFAFVNSTLEVDEILVRENDVVVQGQPLIRFNSNTRDRDRERERLEIQLRDAQLNLRSAEVALDNTRIPPTQTELENARLNILRAEQGVSDAEFSLTQAELNIVQQHRSIEQQQRNIEQQERNIEQLERGLGQLERGLEQRHRNVEQLERGVEQLRRSREQLYRNTDQIERTTEQIERTVEQLERAVELRQTVLEDAITNLANTQILFSVGAATQNQLDAMERAVENAENDVRNAENEVRNVRNEIINVSNDTRNVEDNIRNLEDSITNAENDIINARNDIINAENEIVNAQDNIINARSNIENAVSDIARLEENIITLENQRTQVQQNISAAHDNLQFARIQHTEIQNRLSNPQTVNSIEQQEIAINRIRLNIEQIQNDLANLNDVEEFLYSPISGTITNVNVVRGEMATPGRALIQISDAEEYILRAFVNERHAGQLVTGQEVLVEGSILGSEVLQGVISSVGTVAQATQISGVVERVVPVEVRVDQEYSRGLLMPGVTLDITIITEVKEDVIAIPILSTLSQRDGGSYVFVIGSDNTLQRREVELGIYADMTVEAAGLSEGEMIVLQPTSSMEEGMLVSPINVD